MMARVFVFGSNLAGIHGKGSALHALHHHGAIRGQGEGRQGDSYAIPTKDERLRTLPLNQIKRYCKRFVAYAKEHPDDTFHVVAVGTGLAGYQARQIAPFFKGAPVNVELPKEFLYIREG